MIKISEHIEVTEDDINYAENILFGKTNVFDCDERIPIIKNFNKSFDVNACPGSGKTTVLLAKLIILSRKMPLKNGQGICVLTHTNVAIDEIKGKLGQKSEALFKYPNYFGTIQSFVDKYLAIPFFRLKTGENIRSIDNDIFYNHLQKLAKGRYPKIKNAINYCVEKSYGNYVEGQDVNNFVKFISSKSFKVVNKEIFICDRNGATLEKKKYYDELSQIMYDGVIRYNDAYVFANAYLSKFPQISSYISNRFKYVFIDEMQDTDIKQSEIFEKIFNQNKGVVIQRFGDLNQRIGLSREESGWKQAKNIRCIDSTKRYGNEMVKFLQPLRILNSNAMIGNEEIETLIPHIIIFNDTSKNKVIDKFINILEEYAIDKDIGKVKVIGKIGVDDKDTYLTIKSYTNSYTKKNSSKSKNKELYNLIECKKLNNFYENLLSVIILSLKDNNKKISKNEFLRYMQTEKEYELICYKSNVKKWFCNMKLDILDTLEDMKEKTNELLSNLDRFVYDKSIIEEKFDIPVQESLTQEQVAATEQVDDSYKIDDINTVFGVKGETHLATLYLESKFINNRGEDRSDITRILDYMLDKKEIVAPEDEEALVTAYVAMSRAQKLTCIAISYETIQGRIREFKEYGYEIIPCDDEIEKLIKIEV